MTRDEKKAALTAAGYTMDDMREQVVSPDAWMLMKQQMSYAEQIDTAYAHWQRAQELAIWRDMASKIWAIDEDTMHHSAFNATVSREAMLAVIRYRNHNITDNDLTHEDVSDLRHNRLDSLYVDDESSETDE